MFYVEDTMNLLLTVKEGSIVILVRGGGGNKSEKKNISIFGKTTYPITMQGESICL